MGKKVGDKRLTRPAERQRKEGELKELDLWDNSCRQEKKRCRPPAGGRNGGTQGKMLKV